MKTEEAGSRSLLEADNSAVNAKPGTKLAEPQSIPPPVRRRGRRKVMKKRTVKDDEGYLGMLPHFRSQLRCISF